jgi:ribosomal protein S19
MNTIKNIIIIYMTTFLFSCSQKLFLTKNILNSNEKDTFSVFLDNDLVLTRVKIQEKLQIVKNGIEKGNIISSKKEMTRDKIIFPKNITGKIIYDSTSHIGVKFEEIGYLKFNLEINNNYYLNSTRKNNNTVIVYQGINYTTLNVQNKLIYKQLNNNKNNYNSRTVHGVK